MLIHDLYLSNELFLLYSLIRVHCQASSPPIDVYDSGNWLLLLCVGTFTKSRCKRRQKIKYCFNSVGTCGIWGIDRASMAKIETHLSLIVTQPKNSKWAFTCGFSAVGNLCLLHVYYNNTMFWCSFEIGELACNKERCLQITNRQDKTSGERKNHWKSYDNNNVNHQACSFPCNFSQSHLEPLQTDPWSMTKYITPKCAGTEALLQSSVHSEPNQLFTRVFRGQAVLVNIVSHQGWKLTDNHVSPGSE